MTTLMGGIVAGLVFGTISAGLMWPMPFPDKRAAISAAFIERFAIGLVIGCVELPWPGWITGTIFGLLLSIPTAIITKAYKPVLIMGTLGGLLVGGFLHGWTIV